MNKKYTINGIRCDLPGLSDLCLGKISDKNIPDWEYHVFSFIREWLSPNNHIELKTSGSTGKQKSIKLAKEVMRNSASMAARLFSLKKDDNVLCCLSAEFIAGKMMIVRALENAYNLILVKPSSNPLADMENISIHLAAVVPSQLHTLLFDSNNKDGINNVKTLLVGGGLVSEKISNAVQEIRTKVYQTYGMTETASHVAVRSLNGPACSENYQTIEDNHFAVTEDNRLIIIAPQLGITKLETQDIIELVSPQEFKWLGRADNIINSGGVKINPEVIEQKLEHLLSEYNYFISSKPDDILGEIMILVIESEDWNENNNSTLGLKMKKALRKYEIPKVVCPVIKFIYTESHKINRKATTEKIRDLQINI